MNRRGFLGCLAGLPFLRPSKHEPNRGASTCIRAMENHREHLRIHMEAMMGENLKVATEDAAREMWGLS